MIMAKLPVPKTLNKRIKSVKPKAKQQQLSDEIDAAGKKKKAKVTVAVGVSKPKSHAKSVAGGKKTKKSAEQQKLPLVLAPTAAADAVSDNDANSAANAKKPKQKNAGKKPSVVVVAKPKLSKIQKKKANKKLYKKQLKLKRKLGQVKEKKPVAKLYEPVPFDEDKFHAIVNIENVQKVLAALRTLVGEQLTAKKKGIFIEHRYVLNVANFKIANCPKRMVKLNLQHSMVDKDDDVVIVVPDLERGAKFDYEPTIQHYEDLFRAAEVRKLKVMPFNQLRKEYNTFEAVRKLANTYDYFLCDGRLVARLAGFCGKIFQKPRTTFHSVRLENAKNVKSEIEKALSRTAYKQLHKGDLITIPFGTQNMNVQQLAENVLFIVAQLQKLYPGGLANVRNMHLKIDVAGTSSMPIYMSLAEPPEQTPYVVGPREKRMLELKKQANEVLSKFSITKDANIIKLNAAQIKRKRAIKAASEALVDYEQPPTDGSETGVPAKRAKKDDDKSDKNAAERNDEDDEDSNASANEGADDDAGDDYPDDDEDDDDDDSEGIDEDAWADEDEDDAEEEDDDVDGDVNATADVDANSSVDDVDDEDEDDDNDDDDDVNKDDDEDE